MEPPFWVRAGSQLMFKNLSITCALLRSSMNGGCAGLHLEGPFISVKKRGAHPERFLRTFPSGGLADLMEVYGSLDNVALVTLAPELEHSLSVVRELSQRGITVSLGRAPLDGCVRDSRHATFLP